MGNCDSSNQFLNNRRDSSKFVPNYSSPSLPVVTSLKEKKYNLISHKSKKNLSTERNTYLLPENISKREDITKIYRLSKNIFSYGATSLLYIGEKNTKEKFAVKRILKQNIIKKQKMLVKEAEICIKLHHDNIIKYYEIYEDKNFINIVMELGDIDLFEFISKSPNSIIPDLLAIDLLIQIFQVIDFIHSNNIIHCDIKPENFVVIFNKNNKNHPILKLISLLNKSSLKSESIPLQKGSHPVSILNINMPAAHSSTFSLNPFPSKISGAIYSFVPQKFFNLSFSSIPIFLAFPKSINFKMG